MPITILRHDITQMTTDAIVNAANTNLSRGGGVCGAIFAAAGHQELQAACVALAPLATGEAVVTPAFSLSSRYIIHAVGPIYSEYTPAESERLLRLAYTNALQCAVDAACESVAFPLISSGIYGYPKAEAFTVAASAIQDYLHTHDVDIDVSLVVFDKEAFVVSEVLHGAVERYIDEHYVDAATARSHRRYNGLQAQSIEARKSLGVSVEAEQEASRHFSAMVVSRESAKQEVLAEMSIPSFLRPKPVSASESADNVLDDIVNQLDDTFAATLLRLIDASGKSDVEVYKRANIDRKLFSKIRSNMAYNPSKPTVLAFAVALELSLEQTEDLLNRAGFALSHSRKFDVIVEYFIVQGKHNVHEINEVLFSYDQILLGG